jgi:hypothetical protein
MLPPELLERGFIRACVPAAPKQVTSLEVAGFAVWLIGIHWVGVAGKPTAARAARAEIGI